VAINFNFVCQSCEAEITVALDEADAGVIVEVGCGSCGHINGQLVFGEDSHLHWAEVEAEEDRAEFRNGQNS